MFGLFIDDHFTPILFQYKTMLVGLIDPLSTVALHSSGLDWSQTIACTATCPEGSP
jgi:hypothetical protein